MTTPTGALTREDVLTAEVVRAVKAALSSIPELEFGQFTQDSRSPVTHVIGGERIEITPGASVVRVDFPNERIDIVISTLPAVPA